MQRTLMAALWVGILVSLGFGGGCAMQRTTTETLPGVLPSPVAPSDWTRATSGAYVAEQGRVFYAIGTAGGMHNTTLLRATADNQAQAEMTRVLNNYVRALAQAAGSGGDEAPLYLIVKAALQKAHIVDHRQQGSGNSSLVALCRLELNVFKQVLAAESELDGALRTRMLAQADRVHGELAASR
jgi:hypothetical protein